jgi:hypothetical protein
MDDRLEKFGRQLFPVPSERTKQLRIGFTIAAERCRGAVKITMKTDSSSVIEGMRERNVRLNPLQTESLERKAFKKWRTRGKRMNGGTNIMNETRQRQLSRTRSATDGVARFEDENGTSGARQDDRRGETIWSRTDNYRVQLFRHGVIVSLIQTDDASSRDLFLR